MEGPVEQWMGKVEAAMQDTIAKQVNYAVSSFPKQSLDEWILDYPQQVILTTIHLILSHEVTELLEDMYNEREAKLEGKGSRSKKRHGTSQRGIDDDEESEEEGGSDEGDSESENHDDGVS